MATTNNITGDLIKSRSPSQKYLDNYDRIFRKKDIVTDIVTDAEIKESEVDTEESEDGM